MKRLLILVVAAALAMYVTSRPALAASGHHGGHHGGHAGHHGGHIGHHRGHVGHHRGHVGHHRGHVGHHRGHVGHHRGVGHLGRHSVHHGSGLHLSFGSGRHHSSYYGYRYPYRSSYVYSYPTYRSSYYPTYQRAYRYVSPSCSSPSVIVIRPNQPNQPKVEEDEQPKVEPAPEPVPAPVPAAVPGAVTSPRSQGMIRYAVLRSEQPLSERATVRQPAKFAPNRIAGPTPRPSTASKRPSAAGALGPQLAVPKVRSLISDDDVPWVAQ